MNELSQIHFATGLESKTCKQAILTEQDIQSYMCNFPIIIYGVDLNNLEKTSLNNWF